jgi:hypothetical protein
MASFESHRSCAYSLLIGFALLTFWPSLAGAQQQAAGFALERLYQSAPGGGWFVMDDLDISGRLGGVVSLTSGYARNPLVITGPDGKQKLAVVSEEAFLDIGAAITYDRLRGYNQLSHAPSAQRNEWDAWSVSVHRPISEPRNQSRHRVRPPYRD